MVTLHIINKVVSYDENGVSIPEHQEFYAYDGGRSGAFICEAPSEMEGEVFLRVWGGNHTPLWGDTLQKAYPSIEAALDAFNERYPSIGVQHIEIQKGGYGGATIVALAL